MNDLERHQAYQRGPGSSLDRAVYRAYVETRAIEFECENCGAHISEFCKRTPELGGGDRKAPCPTRIITARTATQRAEETES